MAPETQVSIPSSLPKNIPLDVLIGYSEQGIPTTQIAKLVGCSPNNIYERFKSIDYTPAYLKVYKAQRADILAQKQRELLNSFDSEDIKKMAPRDKVLAYGILYDKEQLERRSIQDRHIEDDSLDDLNHQFQRIATRSPVVINNILNIVGTLPQEIRDRVSKMIPQSLASGNIIDCDANG